MKHLSLALIALLAACPKGNDKKPTDPTPIKKDADSHTLSPRPDLALLLPPQRPLQPLPNSLPPPRAVPNVERTGVNIAFGELLFHDARLSTTGKHSCATCHDPANGFSGSVQATAAGSLNLRRTPTLLNLMWTETYGWDGRYPVLVDMLDAHIKGQLGQPMETGITAVAELPQYKAHIAHAGGTPHSAAINALAAYSVMQFEGDAPWDELEKTATQPKPGMAPDPIVAGYLVFAGKGQCAVCHPPPLYTDGRFYKVVADTKDPGRGLVDKDQTGAFRTPTLRGVALRGPLFHNGSAKTLKDAIAYYATVRTLPGLDPVLAKISLTPADQANLGAFITALSKQRPAPSPITLP